MSEDIEIRKLSTFETASDGSAVRLLIEDAAGREMGLVLAIDCLTSLLMTLPKIASIAVTRANNDPDARIAYPMSEFKLELSPENMRILTLGTPDGFRVSFSLTEELSEELGYAHLDGMGLRVAKH